MKPQKIILHNLSHHHLVTVITGFSQTIKTQNDSLSIPYFYLSPAMTIPDMKEYILSELEEIVEIGNIDSMVIWSTIVNIEYSNPYKVYNPSTSNPEEFSHNTIIPDPSIFEVGPIYITAQFGAIKSQRSDKEESFFKRLYKLASEVVFSTRVEYIDVFRSSFKLSDFYLLKKVIPSDYQITMFTKVNQELLVTGHLLPLIIPEGYFLILISKNREPVLEITESKIVTHQFDFFEDLITKIMQHQSDFIIPERYYNSVKYNIQTEKRINNRFSEYENISLFFLQPQAWDSDNILQTKNKKISIFLSSQGLKVRSTEPADFMVDHISRLLIGYAMMHPKEDDLKFDKISGVYWSRICQNTKDEIRKPVKRIESNTISSPESQVLIEGELFECLTNSKNKFIGFLNKPYELSSICLPCCYQSSQIEKPIFKKCTEEATAISSAKEEIFSLFIIDENRLLNKNRIGFLDEVVDDFLNKDAPIVTKNKMLVSCKNFFFLSGNDATTIDFSINNLISYQGSNPQIVIIHDKTFYTSKYLDITKPISYKAVVKNFLYVVIRAMKKENEDLIVVEKEYKIHPEIKSNDDHNETQQIQYISNIIRIPITTNSDNRITKDGSVNTINMTKNYLAKLDKLQSRNQ